MKKIRIETIKEILRMPIVFKYGEVSREIEKLLPQKQSCIECGTDVEDYNECSNCHDTCRVEL